MKGHGGKAVWYARKYDAAQAGSIDGSLDGSVMTQEGEAPVSVHDHGLVRAIRAQQLCLHQLPGPPSSQGAEDPARRTLFVTRLEQRTTEDQVSHHFSAFGLLSKVSLVRNMGQTFLFLCPVGSPSSPFLRVILFCSVLSDRRVKEGRFCGIRLGKELQRRPQEREQVFLGWAADPG